MSFFIFFNNFVVLAVARVLAGFFQVIKIYRLLLQCSTQSGLICIVAKTKLYIKH